ncbi:MAG: tail fiber domain-containing protein [Flavobacteriales bacterium]|nr:tail fiber domain-containing protein [Flavobacteriales bacterium]
MTYNTTGSNNTAVGVWAGPNTGALGGTIAIGYTATATITNRAVIGTVANNNLTGGYGAWQNLSDGRFKRQVQENVPGLAFITKLRPVTYTLDARAVDTFLGIAQRMDTLSDRSAKARYDQRLAEVSAETQTGLIARVGAGRPGALAERFPGGVTLSWAVRSYHRV